MKCWRRERRRLQLCQPVRGCDQTELALHQALARHLPQPDGVRGQGTREAVVVLSKVSPAPPPLAGGGSLQGVGQNHRRRRVSIPGLATKSVLSCFLFFKKKSLICLRGKLLTLCRSIAFLFSVAVEDSSVPYSNSLISVSDP